MPASLFVPSLVWSWGVDFITGLVIALVPLQALKMILPELADTLERVNRPLAVSLAKEPAAVALKLVSLRSIFPNANILKMIERR